MKAEWKIAQARRIELERQLAALLPASRPATAGDGLEEVAKAFAKVRDNRDKVEEGRAARDPSGRGQAHFLR